MARRRAYGPPGRRSERARRPFYVPPTFKQPIPGAMVASSHLTRQKGGDFSAHVPDRTCEISAGEYWLAHCPAEREGHLLHAVAG